MNQQEALAQLSENEQQRKQFNDVAKMLDAAISKEMPVFMKLVQFDVMSGIQKKVQADGVDAGKATGQLTETLDKILKQVNDDLKSQIDKQLKNLQQ